MRLLRGLYKKRYLLLIILFIAFIFRLSVGYFGEAVGLYIKQIALEYSSNTLEEVMKDDILGMVNGESFMTQILNNEGDVVYSYVDAYKVNKVKNEASSRISEVINKIDSHEDFQMIELPLGYFFSKNIFLSNGIKVPIKLDVVGSHNIDLLVEAKPYGINSSIVLIYLDVSIEVQVTIPFQGDAIECKQTIPLSIEIINSDIPEYYYNGATPIISAK